jgi:hypothetical protein
MFYKDFERKRLIKKKYGRDPQGAWRQDELSGGKPPVVKWPWLGLLTLSIKSQNKNENGASPVES